MSSRILTTADAAEWEAVLPAGRSAFGSVAFARASEQHDERARALLIVAEAAGSRAAYPVLVRDVRDLALDEGVAGSDAATPPFTGPIVVEGSGEEASLAEEVERLLVAEGVIAEFAHLHPWASAPRLAGGGEPDREIVWVDLTLDPDRLWREGYSKACRKNVKRARREGVEVRAARSADEVSEFHRIYIATMERNEASPAYFFGEDYFQRIFGELGSSARFVLAEHGGEVVAATLYLHDGDDVYSYLGGADHAHQELRPTNAVVHETIEWARAQGKRRLILGGGYRPDDGIFRFKASFSGERATLELARRIHRGADYERLVAAWRERGGRDGGFFPLYRAPVEGG